jgi:hypothetical protein
MKSIRVVMGLIALLIAPSVFANATATSVTGTVQAQAGSAPTRIVRQGDVLRAGDTVTTGAGSSTVLRFEDGQTAALSANSRMTISSYTFNRQAGTGNVLLSLLDGGLRAITGLIGRNDPAKVTYKAASVTIGIRGTDTDIVVGPAGVVATVNDGSISFAMPGQAAVIISAGEAAHARPDGTFSRGAIQQIANQLGQTSEGQQILAALNGLQGLSELLGAPAGASTSNGLTVSPGPPGSGSSGGGGTSTR